jgi:hypothetical protein
VSAASSFGQPAGIPISRAILLPPGPLGDELSGVLAAINRVHGDGLLTQLAVDPDPTIKGQSAYEYTRPHGIPYRIAIRLSALRPRLLLVHEVGHFLDHQGFGVVGVFSSPTDPLLAAWREAVAASRAFGELRDFAQRSLSPESLRFLGHLLGYDELWARSYEQYISLVSRESTFLRQLSESRRLPFWPTRLPPLWNDDEFEPIGRTIEDLLRSLKWTT